MKKFEFDRAYYDRWYRKRLERHFVNLGGGLFLSRSCAATGYELWTA